MESASTACDTPGAHEAATGCGGWSLKKPKHRKARALKLQQQRGLDDQERLHHRRSVRLLTLHVPFPHCEGSYGKRLSFLITRSNPESAILERLVCFGGYS